MTGEKRYYKIGDVCRIAGIKPHILRYWEKEIRSVRPDRSLKNQRLYSSETLDRIVQVKKLLDEGFKLESAGKKLKQHDNPDMQDALLELKNDLQKLKTLLNY